MTTPCLIVPPHILRRLAASGDPRVARAAERTLARSSAATGQRQVRAARSGENPRNAGGVGLIPPHLRERAEHRRQEAAPPRKTTATLERTIYDAQQGTSLPGRQVRAEGEEPTRDKAVNEAYDGLGDTWTLYWEAFGRNSLDDKGLPLIATVHYDKDFDNAYWDGEQMVFGDGDGTYFNGFTSAVDVIGHELTHGVTQYTVGFTYVGQSGALNESVSDVFGSMVKQRVLGQTAEQADWLIGQGLFTAKVKGEALRSMKAPGTAYDDPRLGKDPQPADMDGYQELPHDEQNDNGGVHINSGIPNRAFYLAATGIGGNSWEGAGLVWYDVITQGGLPKDAEFSAFATATIKAAGDRFGQGSSQQQAVESAWKTVKVTS
ncbi:peptidase M4 family protein [Calidifontibacter sp. DB0510]|uniref:Neutral metalloproteinase n=1 Tax=Metallococcus carri TaxID=1656884 RepID=A0A967AXD8_9MICO|nr:M4 family metallopeptidase [Metallococcus carri]NHN54187.1 peptidase M4 family protein [Metallococcus carri]NOP36973.1 peptidase M4 family protein [Calidifontibacter sp. DB2511S]